MSKRRGINKDHNPNHIANYNWGEVAMKKHSSKILLSPSLSTRHVHLCHLCCWPGHRTFLPLETPSCCRGRCHPAGRMLCLFRVLYQGLTQSPAFCLCWAAREPGKKTIRLFSGSLVGRRLCFLQKSTRGMCYKQREDSHYWVTKKEKCPWYLDTRSADVSALTRHLGGA